MILNEDELTIIQNQQFFKLKQSALQKIENELAMLGQNIKNHISNIDYPFPKKTDIQLGKISKGENYKGLPYRILDFPRLFSQDGVFAYRVMFLWSKGFYFTFHLSGKYLEHYLLIPEKQFSKWQEENVSYYNHEDQWQHEVEAPFYYPIKDIKQSQLQQIAKKQGFMKFARKLNIEQIENLQTIGLESFQLFFNNEL